MFKNTHNLRIFDRLFTVMKEISEFYSPRAIPLLHLTRLNRFQGDTGDQPQRLWQTLVS